MDRTASIIRGTVLLVLSIVMVGWIMWRWLKGSGDDAGRLISKWVITVVLILMGFTLVSGSGQAAPILAVPFAIIIGLIWTPNVGAFLASPLTGLFDGGGQEVEPQAFYSIAETQRQKGNFRGAIAEIQKQLALFPNDYTGMMLLAAIQAEDLNDVAAAEVTVERLVQQSGTPFPGLATALNQLADWHLKYGQDPDSARLALEKVIALFPDTQYFRLASQRIAHLSSANELSEAHERPLIAVPHYVPDLGLQKESAHRAKAEVDPETMAANYVKHLEQYPLDAEAREELAKLYAEHYHRLDLAENQLEQLIAQPHESIKQVVRWLNLLADLQVKFGNDAPAAEKTLRRIVGLFPASAAAENAQARLASLNTELKANERRQPLKLGAYEKNIGLKSP